eukprot:m.302855 g.302855  ORF g.302855 m.302855 type:complete len:364 (-) comp15504_c0_seq1:262-1353(-)
MGSRHSRQQPSADSAAPAALEEKQVVAAVRRGPADLGNVDFALIEDVLRHFEASHLAQTSGQDEGEAVSSSVADASSSVSQRGVSLSFLFAWHKEQQTLNGIDELTTREVVDKIVRPATAQSGEALWFQLPEEARGVPTAAISHAWDTKFAYLMGTVRDSVEQGHRPLASDTFVWLDLFALVQHTDGSNKQRAEIQQLGDVFGKDVKKVLQILPSSSDITRAFRQRNTSNVGELGAFDRAWCVFELAKVIQHGGRYEIGCQDANKNLTAPLMFAAAWRPHLAQALFESDKQHIDSLVLEIFGSWNTLKAIMVMIQLKANNVSDTAPSSYGMFAPWQAAFPGDAGPDWSKFVDLYLQFYRGRLR